MRNSRAGAASPRRAAPGAQATAPPIAARPRAAPNIPTTTAAIHPCCISQVITGMAASEVRQAATEPQHVHGTCAWPAPSAGPSRAWGRAAVVRRPRSDESQHHAEPCRCSGCALRHGPPAAHAGVGRKTAGGDRNAPRQHARAARAGVAAPFL
jgi:hypothetical protein